ncbi:TetM/TetW/TetO/TetS family tetracycline resistance ribosomal protection protein [Paenibacillus motobuensis]|uniref:GTP-binding protein n=1 Tax=Paenibacillus TaxID=44249 RepID=UPI0020422C38|nr:MULTISPECIES: TetM/TetW/TetO/TetS family tetracycline resistance ribosomal protection protein [Paenibacillus]MCM3042843.1 TetM/TetW/TetO/TetS family tetracycline resistance ribosomal protection protein [Paenibacillus lutimineralis]MCM3649947.1 TetM/TetW/TetO/TetS family tetracycline resistance ribosomal protection protein [Paenibacillus motobuensis]
MAQSRTKRLNVGIFAHVDAGKTTTTEHILFESGRTRELGSVDEGTALTDSMDVERQRGISVRSALTAFHWNGAQINLVDTPGHVDFLSEVERSLRVMDCAVLIVSAVEGVQAQTEMIWNGLRRLGIPTLLFVNKMDRGGADSEAVLEQIRKHLSPDAIPLQIPLGREQEFRGTVHLLDEYSANGGESPANNRPEYGGNGVNRTIENRNDEEERNLEEARNRLYDFLAERDDALFEAYLENNTVPEERWISTMSEMIRKALIFPVMYGAASRGIGIPALLDAIVQYLPDAGGNPQGALSGIVFKIERDKTMGRMAYVRVYEGSMRNRDIVYNHTQGIQEKVTQIRKVEGGRTEDLGLLEAGDIAAVCGLTQVRIGDVLGGPEAIPPEAHLAVPLLTVRVHWANKEQYSQVVQALQELSDEDPLLDVQWLQDERELHVKVMGPIQLEILSSILETRYGLSVTFGQPSVIYKETPLQSGEGFIAYTMPKPCWAILRFKIEPGPRGSGLVYESQVKSEDLLAQYQNEVQRRVPEALMQGLHGWEVTDLKVTLVYGQHHVWHTHPLDFAVATPMGMMDGLANTGTALLEPMLRVRIIVPEENGGRVMNDLVQMRGTFDSPVLHGERMLIEGRVPLATSMNYPVELSSYTKGRSTFASFFDGYEPCPPEVKAVRQRRGVNPLDQAKYILSVRKALQG